ncbi:LysR family transcriptional regulator [Cochlodiniinecator piscidefendens]|uniref:LysR family transcriptional regulator n=1 Tax=Cochlodiniinecator piscidefendens TaxID=2715756 RepID=UPI0014081B37|nr:LysR family transcriptional regulator [Cochlodiniinecator piscidefendens]
MERAPVYGIEVFLTIIREGSLKAAADTLGVGAPAVSLQLKSLEEKMGVGLIHRTTRNIELTDAGRILFETAAPAYRDMVDAIRKTQETASSLTGTLRLAVTRGAYMTAIAPILKPFLADHPGLNIDISLSEGLTDIVQDGFHAGVRLGDILAPDMIAVRLTPPLTSAFSASPSYLDQHGRPSHPSELLNHQCIRYKLPSANKIAAWQFIENGQEKTINPPARLVFDSVGGVIQAARDGHGIGWSLRATITDRLDSGELETILSEYSKDLPPFYLYYPEQNRRIECLRVFIDYLIAHQKKERRYDQRRYSYELTGLSSQTHKA